MSAPAFSTMSTALAAGVSAQIIAARLQIPSIVLLLVAGAVLGPEVLGWLDPSAFGHARAEIVDLVVTIILFEGGLALDLRRLLRQQRSLLRLLTIGAAISGLGGALAARFLLDVPWSIAALYGSLMVVTGPTVVTPLLSRIRVDRRVRELLIGEGVIIDPIGAIAAVVTLELVVERHDITTSGGLALFHLGLGTVVGIAGGKVLSIILSRRWVPHELINPFALAVALFVSSMVGRISAEAGLMAAVASGMTLARDEVPAIGRLREFKETLTVILLSFLFVFLAANLRFGDVQSLGWSAVGVVAALIWIARPIAVAVSTWGSELSHRERAFVAWVCPRGIVAAAVAGLVRIRLDELGVSGGAELEALVFVTVAFTVTVQGLTARPIARMLGVDFPSLTGTVLVGAGSFARLVAHLLSALGRPVVLVDRNIAVVRAAVRDGLLATEGDALSVDDLDRAGARYADTFVAMTPNDELNVLATHTVRENLLLDRVLAVESLHGDEGGHLRPFPGQFPGVEEANRLARSGKLCLIEYPVGKKPAIARIGELPYGQGEFALALQRGESVIVADASQQIAAGDRIWCARPDGTESELATALGTTEESDG